MPSDAKAQYKGLITANSFSGPTTFFRRHSSRDFANADVVIQGLPYDLAVSNRAGARFGPRSIREASCQLAWGSIYPWNFDPFDELAVIDAGDVEYPYGSYDDFFKSAIEQTDKIVAAGAIPLSLGGDHSIAAATLTGINRHHREVSLIHFDAHTDTSEGGPLQHGSMFLNGIDAGEIDPAKSIQIGIRTAYDPKLGYHIISAEEAMRVTPAEIARAIVERVADRPCYLTIDIDCLDPSQAPGTGTPVPGGLSTLRLLEILRALKGATLDIVGMDLVEVAPDYDWAQITSLAAAQICVESLCLICCNRQNQQG